MSFLPHFHSSFHHHFPAYQDTNCVRERGRGVLADSFDKQLQFLEEIKKTKPKTKQTNKSLKINLLRWIISADSERLWCGGQSCFQSLFGLLRGIWDGGWAASREENMQMAYLEMNLRGYFSRSWAVAPCFPKPSPSRARCRTAACCVRASAPSWWLGRLGSPCCTSACRM